MPVNRKRVKRDLQGTVSPWVAGYLKTGKGPRKGEDGFEEFCSYELLNINVRGLPEKNRNGFWFIDHKGK